MQLCGVVTILHSCDILRNYKSMSENDDYDFKGADDRYAFFVNTHKCPFLQFRQISRLPISITAIAFLFDSTP